MHMTKVISISDKAYDSLKRVKGEDSFSEIILRLTQKPKKNLLEIIKSMAPDEELANNIEEVYKRRKDFKLSRVEF